MKHANLRQLRLRLAGLSVYRGVLQNPVAAALYRLICGDYQDEVRLAAAYADVFAACAAAGCAENAAAEIEAALLRDDNPYTRCLAAGKTPSPLLEKAALWDIATLRIMALLEPYAFGGLWPNLFSGLSAPNLLALWKPGQPGPLFFWPPIIKRTAAESTPSTPPFYGRTAWSPSSTAIRYAYPT